MNNIEERIENLKANIALSELIGPDELTVTVSDLSALIAQLEAKNIRAEACVNAFEGIETERFAGKSIGEFLAGEVRLNKAEPKPDGSFGFTFSGLAIQIMAESFADQFKSSGAINYLELLFEHSEIGPLTVTMQRVDGLIPAQKLAAAEAALSAANEKPKPISFDELAERVKFVTEGIRMEFDPQFYKGHQAVPFMNFNSLSRIVEMYRTALQTPVVRQQHADWSNATFGNVGPVGPLKHLSKEALETAASPDDLSEWADMQFLFWDAQRRAGITDAQIEQAMIDKLEINKSRVWPEPKDGEPREHIKAGFPVEE